MIDKIALKNAYDRLVQLDFPDHPESEELDNCIFDNLLELDGYIAGIASTILAQGNANGPNLIRKVEETESQLNQVQNLPAADALIYDKCKQYVQLLKEIANIIESK